MSLWSPVDLVNGSGTKKNLTNGNGPKNYNQILEQMDDKIFPQANLTQDQKNAIYNQLLQNQFKTRMLNSSSTSDSGNNSADNQQQTSNRNRNVNDNQRSRNNSNQLRGSSNNKNSNQRNNQSQLNFGSTNMPSSSSSNKRNNLALDSQIMDQLFNNPNTKKMKINHNQQQQQINQSAQLNPQYQLLQASVQMQFAQFQKQQIQQAAQLQIQQQLQAQQLMKQVQQEAKQQQAKKNELNKLHQLSQISQLAQLNQLTPQQQATLAILASASGGGGDGPLDLCVSNSNNNSSNKKSGNDIFAIANQLRQQQLLATLANNNAANNSDFLNQLDNDQSSALEQMMKQKRGRKPKTSTQTSAETSLIQSTSSSSSYNQHNKSSSNFDLLNNLNNNARESPSVHQSSSSSLLLDNKPRKRGRPPSNTNNQSNQQQQQNNNNSNNNSNNSNNSNNPTQLAQLLSLFQSNPELINSPIGKQLLYAIAGSNNNNGNNNSSHNRSNNNGLSQQDMLTAQLQQQINQIKLVQQAQMLIQSSNNRQQSSSSTATQSTNNKNLNSGKVVVEEVKTRDQVDSDQESDSELNKDQITFVKNYDERILRIPMACDWRRQTFIKLISKSGVRGDVFYISPCGKKFKNFSEVDKYLMKLNKNSLRKEHFNFSPRIIIGDFIEQVSDKANDFRALSENEVINRIESIRRSALKKLSSSTTANSFTAGNNAGNNATTLTPTTVNSISTTIAKALTTSTASNKQNNNQTALSDKKATAVTAATNNSSIETNKLDKLELEKSRQLAEAKLKEELERQKQAKEDEAKRMIEMQREQKEQEAKRKKDLALLVEFDKERRKQNQVLVRILESNRRNMDRDKKLASFTNDRRLQQDRRNLKKRIETEIQKEIKKPVEDMILKDLNNLQTLNRIPGLKLAGKAFADLLMVYEFLHNFYECINLDKDRIPTLNTLQSALLNLDECAESELMDILQHLLTIVIDDPGIPYNPNTLIGQKLKDIQINSLNITEVLKLYFQSYVSQIREDSVLERIEFKIYNILDSGKPYLSLNASTKIEILAYICNELLCNQTIIKKIEDRIENASNVKRDKWVIENDLKKYKLLKVKREKREDELAEEKARQAELKKTVEGEREEDSDSDHDSQVYGNEIDGEDQLTNAEIDKNIEKLTKSVNNQSNKLNKIVNSYRVTSFGQDRYRRRYWCLPNAGAVLVESMESCEIEENLKLLEEEERENEELDEEMMDEEIEDEKMDIVNGDLLDTKDIKEEEKNVKIKEEINDFSINNCSKKKRKSINDATTNEDSCSNKDQPIKFDEIKNEEENAELNNDLQEDNQNNKAEKDDQNENESSKAQQNEEDATITEQKSENEMPNYLDLLNSEWIQPIISNVYSNYPSQNSSLLGTTKKTTVLPGLEFLTKNQLQQARQVFNILPRTSCSLNVPSELPDFSGTTNVVSDEDQKITTIDDKQQDLDQYKINDVIILPQELDIDANLQSQLIELKKLEFIRPNKIDEEYRYGWWNITDTSQLRQVAESMHERACRERNLKKHILKYFNNLAAKIRQNNVEFDITDLDRIISQKCPYGAPVQQSDEEWSENTALKLDILVLELVENLEETISSSSMQIRGWKPMPRTEIDREFICYPLYNTPKPNDLELDDTANNKTTDQTHNSQQTFTHSLKTRINNPILIARERLLTAEAGIERRYLKPPLGFKSNTILLTTGNDEYADNANDENATSGLVRWRDAVRVCESGTQLALLLHFLESCIAWDKSIMRASCQFCNSGENEAELLLCDQCDKGYHLYCFRPKMETIPDGDWYCYECLNKNSMDKVCVICGKKGKLINCDTCTKVFHPNCLDPPVNKPQKGRWFCFACVRKSKKPIKSGSATNRQSSSKAKDNEKLTENKASNDKSSKNETIQQSSAKTKENKKKGSKKSLDKDKKEKETPIKEENQSINEKDNSKDKETTTNSSSKKESKKKEPKSSENKKKESRSKSDKETNKEKSRKKPTKELGTSILLEPKKDNYNPSPFEILLEDIEQHKDSWPFLKPVDTNEYPLYKNIIKKPMDFEKIKQKNDAGQYTDPEAFIADCRLIFDNCETFNEDESEVVKAGRNLREFIEKRWKELID